MTTTSWEQVRAEGQRIAPWVIPIISSCSAQGTTATLLDAYLFQSTNSYYITTTTGQGMWIHRPDAAVVGDRERRIGTVAVATGTLTIDGAAWTNLPINAEQYEISSIQPQTLFNLFVQACQNFPLAEFLPLSDGNDEDMEASGTTNYSVSGAGAVSKVTAAGNVDSGAQSLFFNAGTASEYLEGPTYRRMIAGRSYRTSVTYRVDVGGPVYFAIWNKTADTEIESGSRVSHSLESFMTCERTFTVPTGCEEVALRLYVTGNTDDVYVDNFQRPRKSSDTVLTLPSIVTRDSEVRKIYSASYGDQYATGVYDTGSRRLNQWAVKGRDFNTRFNANYANPGRVELRDGVSLPNADIYIEVVTKVATRATFAFTAAGETAPTTNVDRYFLTLAWLKLVSKYALSLGPDDAEARETLDRCNSELTIFMADYEKDLDTPQQEPVHPLAGRMWDL